MLENYDFARPYYVRAPFWICDSPITERNHQQTEQNPVMIKVNTAHHDMLIFIAQMFQLIHSMYAFLHLCLLFSE